MNKKTPRHESTHRLRTTLSVRLRAARTAIGLTQKAVAEQAGISEAYYAVLERVDARPFPSVETLVRLGTLFDVSFDHLLGIDVQSGSLASSSKAKDPKRIVYIVDKARDDPDLMRVVNQLLKYCEQPADNPDEPEAIPEPIEPEPEAIAEPIVEAIAEPDERTSLTIDPAGRALALAIWSQNMVDTAAEQPVDDIHSHLPFWRRIDQQLIQDVLFGDTALSYFANYLHYMQSAEHRTIVIQVILGMHSDERRALEPSILGALLEHDFTAVCAALRSRLQQGDPLLLDRLRRAVMRSYTPRNSTGIFDATHRREEETWTRLMTVLLDPIISSASILDALGTGIMHHLDRGIRHGTIEVNQDVSTGLGFDTKFTSCHETVLMRAFRLLEIG